MCLFSDCPIQVFEISLTFPYPKLVMVSPTYPFCSPLSLHCNPFGSGSYLLELQSISFLPQLQQSSRKTSKLSHIPPCPLTSNTKYIRIKFSFMFYVNPKKLTHVLIWKWSWGTQKQMYFIGPPPVTKMVNAQVKNAYNCKWNKTTAVENWV